MCDLKSGSRVPDKYTQLGLYRVALQQNHEFDNEIIGGMFLARKSQPTEVVDLRQYTPDYFNHIFSMADSIREAEAFLPNPGSFCRICDVRKHALQLAAWRVGSMIDNPQHKDWVGYSQRWKPILDFPQDTHTVKGSTSMSTTDHRSA